jgi:hypothetical protein
MDVRERVRVAYSGSRQIGQWLLPTRVAKTVRGPGCGRLFGLLRLKA